MYEKEVSSDLSNSDAHFWCFTDLSFLKIIIDMIKSKLCSFQILEFFPTVKNTQEFGVVLQKNEDLLNDEEKIAIEIDKIYKLMDETLKFHYTILDDYKNFKLIKEINFLKAENKKLKKRIKNKNNLILKYSNSSSWKITKPLRKFNNIIRNKK